MAVATRRQWRTSHQHAGALHSAVVVSLRGSQRVSHPSRRATKPGGPHTGDADALFKRLDSIEQNLERGQDARAAEAAQWFRWEVVLARAHGALARDTAT